MLLGYEITEELMSELEMANKPTFLLTLDGRDIALFPQSVQDYLAHGIEQGLPKKPLISQRKPWYKMEKRRVPPFLFLSRAPKRKVY